jgi:hypothetical protein
VSFAGERRQVASGTTVAQFLIDCFGEVPKDIVAALVNRRLVMLNFPLRGFQVELEAVRIGSREGETVLRARASSCSRRLASSTLTRGLRSGSRSAVVTSTPGAPRSRWRRRSPRRSFAA